ncbi:MAG: peroxiredoxin [Myxococcota bacterium]
MALVGKPAPDIQGQAYINGEIKKFSLAELRGKWVVAFFYPLDFTFVCPTELKAFASSHQAFRERGAEVVAISIDSVFSHKAWIERDLPDVKYAVVSDITKTIARDYAVLLDDKGIALRATFIIDPKGVVQAEQVYNTNLGRSTEETLRILDALQTGEKCPADWKRGQKTLG